jgi:hypothetical protein
LVSFKTEKIGFAAYLVNAGVLLSAVHVRSRNRASFEFALAPEEADSLELEFQRSEFFRYFESFRYLRDRTLRGSTNGKQG